ncbi:S-layer homology domain-containing protein, partial [Aduncisulcus paluster]
GEKWYDAYIFASKANGLISPTAEFDPESNITREEMAEILGQYLETKKIEPKYDPIKFIDESAIDSDSFEAVNSAVRYGLFSGRADGSFDPDATATRAEVAQVIFDLVQLVQ